MFFSPIKSFRFGSALSVFSCICFSLSMEDGVVGLMYGWEAWLGELWVGSGKDWRRLVDQRNIKRNMGCVGYDTCN